MVLYFNADVVGNVLSGIGTFVVMKICSFKGFMYGIGMHERTIQYTVYILYICYNPVG